MKIILILTTLLFPGFKIEYQQGPVSKMTDQYLAIKNALMNNDASVAATHATLLADIIESTATEPAESEAARIFKKNKSQMLAKATSIAGTDDLEAQRSSFAELSEMLWQLIKVSDVGERTLYYDYCPMKKAYWISEEVAIKNPYYGAAMLNCGSVKAKKK